MSCDVPTNPEARIARDTHPCPAKSSTKSRSTDWGMELLFAKRITTNIRAAGEPHFLISITTMFPHKNGRKVCFFFMEYQYRKSCSVSKIIYIYKRKVGNSGMQNFPFENVISTFGIPILLPHWGSKCAAQIHISAVEGHMVVVSRGGIIGTWYPHICIETQSYSRLKTFNEFLASEFVLFLRRVNSTLYLYTVFPFWTPHVIDHKWSH